MKMAVSPRYIEWKMPHILLLILSVFIGLSARAQYTDVINSNRPGESVSAYAVGTGVLQFESGLFYEQQDHSVLDTDSGVFGLSLALRYGLLLEALELHYEGAFQSQNITYNTTGEEERLSDFGRNSSSLTPSKIPNATSRISTVGGPTMYSSCATLYLPFRYMRALTLYWGITHSIRKTLHFRPGRWSPPKAG